MRYTRWYVPVALFIIFIFFNTQITSGQTSLDSMLKPYLSQYDLPAIAAAVVKRGEIVSSGAVGTRKLGSTIQVTPPFLNLCLKRLIELHYMVL